MASNQGKQGEKQVSSQAGKQVGGQGDNRGGKERSGAEQSGSHRGFASMEPERQREIAAEGGRAAHNSGNAHQFTTEQAREAGKKSRAAQSGPGSGDGKKRVDNGSSGAK